MIEEIEGITIKGRCFRDETKINLFTANDGKQRPNDCKRVSLVYGRNGSGKSTIAYGLDSLAHGNRESGILCALNLKDNKQCNEELSNKIFVFSESFIDQNVKLKADGLGTIVQLGPHIELDNKIEELEIDIQGINTELSDIESRLENGKGKAEKQVERCKEKLKTGWAARYREITGNSNKGKVTNDLYKRIGDNKPNDNKENLEKEFKNLKSIYDNIGTISEVVQEPILEIKFDQKAEERLLETLAEKVEEPALTERDQLILDLSKQGKTLDLVKAKETFSNDEVNYCPYCLQPISSEYKHELIKRIEGVLNDRANEHQSILTGIQFPSFDGIVKRVEAFENSNREIYNLIRDLADACQKKVSEYLSYIDQKIKNLYTPVKIASLDLAVKTAQLNEQLLKLEKIRRDILAAQNEKQKTFEKLLRISENIAYWEIIDDYQDYKQQDCENKGLEKNKLESEQVKNKIYYELEQIKAQKKNANLALEDINRALSFIFMSKEKIQLVNENDQYRIKSRGMYSKPNTISVGERNALALCYFFSLMNYGVNKSDVYKSERLIVLDDPISSYDFDNKIGVMSYLNSVITSILNRNESSKVLLLTHDISAFHDLKVVCLDILQQMYSCGKGKAAEKLNWMKLDRHGLNDITNKVSYGQYGEMLKLVYSYADGESDVYELEIGNIARRVLEAYSTFMFGKGMNFVHFDDVRDVLKDYADFFDHLMFKLFLNNESHTEIVSTTACNQMSFSRYISREEQINICKSIICLIYRVTPLHLKYKLGHHFDDAKISKWSLELIP